MSCTLRLFIFLILLSGYSVACKAYEIVGVKEGELHDYISYQLMGAMAVQSFTRSSNIYGEEDYGDLNVMEARILGEDFLSDKQLTLSQLKGLFAIKYTTMPHVPYDQEYLNYIAETYGGDLPENAVVPASDFAFSTANDLQLLQGTQECPACSFINKVITSQDSLSARYMLARILMRPVADRNILEIRRSLVARLAARPDILQQMEWLFRVLRDTERYLIDTISGSSSMYRDWGVEQLKESIDSPSITARVIMPTYQTIADWMAAAFVLYQPFSLLFTWQSGGTTALINALLYSFSVRAALGGLVYATYTGAVQWFWSGPMRKFENRFKKLHLYFAAARELKRLASELQIEAMLENREALEKLSGHSELSCLVDDVMARKHECTRSSDNSLPPAFTLIEAMRNTSLLIDLVAAMGELEAWYYVANLVKGSANPLLGSSATGLEVWQPGPPSDTGYSMAEYSWSDQPLIELHGFWHPLLGKKNAVTNELALAGDNPRLILLTGPNAGGKTTAMQAIANSTLLAQTITVVPAWKLVISPFSFIGTSLYKGGSTDIGLSGFEAEAESANSFVLASDAHQDKGQHAFIYADEPLGGTNCDDTETGVTGLLNMLSKNSHTVAVMTYHACHSRIELNRSGSPIWLAEQSPDTFRNIKVMAEMDDETGDVSYDYLLFEGLSNQTIGLDVLTHSAPENFRKELSRQRKKRGY